MDCLSPWIGPGMALEKKCGPKWVQSGAEWVQSGSECARQTKTGLEHGVPTCARWLSANGPAQRAGWQDCRQPHTGPLANHRAAKREL